ncbi:MAG: heat-inducible transcriptional repressor HrcA [Defluviitaleaceae bacterium]|nr:heat-inducible transcriptional repressor HrcA [Defluviitaleaceae bacterium]
MLGLNERKFKILEAIINDYIQTAEPIGSRTIAKKYGLGISSATIRNEMSDLEDLGLITQPHTSSGRIPSASGYRFYVDSMMSSRPLTQEEAMFLQRMIIDNIYQIEYMMQETAKALAGLTRYPAIVSEPKLIKTKIKHVQLVPLDEKSLLLVLVTDNKTVKNQVVNLNAAPGYDTLTRLSQALNYSLAGKTVKEINRSLIDSLLNIFGQQAHVLMPVLGIIADMIQAEDDVRVFTSGVKNILTFPEFADIRKAEAIFHALEDREMLIAILEQSGNLSPDSIQITIGEENSLALLKNCSLIRANYTIDNQSTGSIALIGPMRMDYAQAVSVLSGILLNIKHVTHALGL